MSPPRRESFENHRPGLYCSCNGALVRWAAQQTGHVTRLPFDGGPVGYTCLLVIYVPARPWPSGSISLLWAGQRVSGLDLDGPPHRDAETGKVVPTPHQQWTEKGREGIASVDLDAEKITNMETAWRWMLATVGLSCTAQWVDPPIQASLPRTRGHTATARGHKRRR